MDNAIRQWIKREVNIGKVRLTVLDILFILGVSVAGALMRYSMKGYAGADYNIFIGPWMERIQELGGINSLGVEVGNYPPLYMYTFTLLSYLPCSYLTSVKVFFSLCDFILAFGCALLVYE